MLLLGTLHLLALLLKAQPLCTDAKLDLGDRVLGEVEKNTFIVWSGTEGHSSTNGSKLYPNPEGFGGELYHNDLRAGLLIRRTSLVAQMVKCLLTMQETQVQSLGQENLLEKEMTSHCRILAWKIPWMEEPGRLQSMGSQRVRHHWATSFSFSLLLMRIRMCAGPACL